MSLFLTNVLTDVSRALSEDLGNGDVSALLLGESQVITATLISREPMLVCGRPWFDATFWAMNPNITVVWSVEEGDFLEAPTTLCEVHGMARDILSAERTALNFLQLFSGTATKTREFVAALHGTSVKILDTRKTVPGLRKGQKYAVALAGGVNHRMGLYDAFLIKENHIRAIGSIRHAIRRARSINPTLFLEIEVETLEALSEALVEKPDRILLDNFTHAMLIEAVSLSKESGIPLEASGGVTLENIRTIAMTGVHFISVGCITKSLDAIDLSLLVKEAN